MKDLPSNFLERLQQIVPAAHFEGVKERFSQRKPLCLRYNTLKVTRQQALDYLREQNISCSPIERLDNLVIGSTSKLSQDAENLDGFICQNNDKERINQLEFVREGKLYFQSAASMLIPFLLRPNKEDNVLDMCAAPGSKTTQMAAMMGNKGEIVAIEAVKARYYKLKSVLTLLGVENVKAVCADARRYRPSNIYFDKILLDAPCSSEGRFDLKDAKTFQYWSERKIEEMAHKQKGLLLRGLQLLKPGGTLVYSTCTFSPEENEGVISWALRKMGEGVSLEPLSVKPVATYSPVLNWRKREFDPRVENCLRILPERIWDAFFIAQFKKK